MRFSPLRGALKWYGSFSTMHDLVNYCPCYTSFLFCSFSLLAVFFACCSISLLRSYFFFFSIENGAVFSSAENSVSLLFLRAGRHAAMPAFLASTKGKRRELEGEAVWEGEKNRKGGGAVWKMRTRAKKMCRKVNNKPHAHVPVVYLVSSAHIFDRRDEKKRTRTETTRGGEKDSPLLF